MKRELTILALIFSACLLIGSQALASDHAEKASDAGSTATEMAATAAEQAPQLGEAQIKELQRLLQDQGYEVGDLNGTLNPATGEAISKFQAAEGLAVTGQPDLKTLKALAPNNEHEFFGLSPEYGEMKER